MEINSSMNFVALSWVEDQIRGMPLGLMAWLRSRCSATLQPGEFYPVDFDPLNPLGNNSDISIDVTTGLITGTPAFIGQFVVGVCVYEYRDGVLLSTIRRDFQFNVTFCEPTVVADPQ